MSARQLVLGEEKMIKLSKTSKMPCKSWSIPAGGRYCPGSLDSEPCKDCYAQKGMYRFPCVKSARQYNADNWADPHWVEEMVKAIGRDKYFRWFDSGDLYHPNLIERVYQVCRQTPETKHWIPTQVWSVLVLSQALTKLKLLPNVCVRLSSKKLDKPMQGRNTSVVITEKVLTVEIEPCLAYLQGGKCMDCRLCWDKNIKCIAYLKH